MGAPSKMIAGDYKLAYYEYVDGSEGPCFCVPIFRNEKTKGSRFLQVINLANKCIEGFCRVADGSDVKEINNNCDLRVRIGDPLVYVFKDGDGQIYSGGIDELQPTLKAALVRYPQFSGLSLQIAELMGSKAERRQYRRAMEYVISRLSGSSSTSESFRQSCVLSFAWSAVLACCRGKEDAAYFLRNLHRIKVVERISGLGVEFLDVPTEYLGSIDSQKIELEMNAEFGGEFEAFTEASESDVARRMQQYEVMVGEILRELNRESRQENRISIVLSSIVQHPEIRKLLLKRYPRDRAIYTTGALRILREMRLGDGRLTDMEVSKLVGAVWGAFSRSMSGNKAILLRGLSEHAGGNAIIRDFVRQKLSNTYSHSILSVRKECERLLTSFEARNFEVANEKNDAQSIS